MKKYTGILLLAGCGPLSAESTSQSAYVHAPAAVLLIAWGIAALIALARMRKKPSRPVPATRINSSRLVS